MALFVHIAAKKDSRAIHRAGIKAAPVSSTIPSGVYAMPVVSNFFMTHQWVRELKRSGQRRMCGIYFRLPDQEAVWFGRYQRPHTLMTAAEALAGVMQLDNAQGYEIIIPRSIEARAIAKIRDLPHVGWRYFPSAHQHRPCGCPVCLRRGEIKSRRIREAYETQFD